MAHIFGFNLSSYCERILEILFDYRGATAKQIVALMHAPLTYTLAQEKSVYNYLRKLKKQGLVVAYKLQANVSNGSLYYLTEKGFNYAKDMLNIEEGKQGSGWFSRFPDDEKCNRGDLPYKVYVPPLKQTQHHLMLIDFFIELLMTYEIDSSDDIMHRINIYAAEAYEVNGKKYRFRPDAEIEIGYKRFAVEIDRATESHEQLLQKFDAYRQYLDYIAACGKEVYRKYDGIIFVVENKRRDHGIKRRWTNILSAFFKTLPQYKSQLNLIMTSLDAARDTLSFEYKRNSFEQKAIDEIESVLKSKGYSKTISWHNSSTGEAVYAHAIIQDIYKVYFNAISQEFESKLYTRYMEFLSEQLSGAKNKEGIKGLKYAGYEKVIFYDLRHPFIVENCSYYGLDPEAVEQLADLQKNVQFHSFNSYLNFSLFD